MLSVEFPWNSYAPISGWPSRSIPSLSVSDARLRSVRKMASEAAWRWTFFYTVWTKRGPRPHTMVLYIGVMLNFFQCKIIAVILYPNHIWAKTFIAWKKQIVIGLKKSMQAFSEIMGKLNWVKFPAQKVGLFKTLQATSSDETPYSSSDLFRCAQILVRRLNDMADSFTQDMLLISQSGSAPNQLNVSFPPKDGLPHSR